MDLDECEKAGLAAGAAAVRGACAALELECPLPDVELRSSYPSNIPEGKIGACACSGIALGFLLFMVISDFAKLGLGIGWKGLVDGAESE